jgi:hypothetical protein
MSAQAMHDELLRQMPSGLSHFNCPLCPPAGTAEKAEEGTPVADKTYSETEHFALLTDAVQRETAALAEVKTTLTAEKSALEVRVTTLESEVAAERTAKEQLAAEFETFKAEVAAREAVAARKDERVSRVKAAAPHLADDYFTPERAQVWAEMSDDVFAVLVEGLETSAQALAAKKGDEKPAGTPAAETAAFRSGASPTSPEGQGSVFTQFLAARRGAATKS